MSGNGNQVPLAPSQRGLGPYPRASTPHRPVECYHPNGASTATYMSSSTGGAQSSSQSVLRVQTTPPQPTAPPAPQQDISKTTMAGHSFVSQPQTQARTQYQNFPQFRATQHGSRPNSHPRHQQPFIPGSAQSTAPVMLHPALVFQPHMGMQAYQQPRSGSPGFYPYMGPYIGYPNNPQTHTSSYYGYAANSPQLSTPSLGTASNSARSQSASLGPQGSPAAPAAPPVSLAHSQPPAHNHQSMSGIRQAPVQKRSRRLAIVDPVTQQDILSDLYPTSSEYSLSGEQNDRQTPQPEPTHSIAEEFTRMVNEAINQPSLENAIKTNFVPINDESNVSSTSNAQPHNAISSLSSINNNNILKSDLVNLNDNRSLGLDAAATLCETPVVSAISNSPVIVPKMTLNVKPNQKIETTVQSNVDTSKTMQINIQTNKRNTLTMEKVSKEKDNVLSPIVTVVTTATVSFTSSTPVAVPSGPAIETVTAPTFEPVAPTFVPSAPTFVAAAPTILPTFVPAAPTYAPAAPLPQRVPNTRDRSHKSEEKDKYKIDKEFVIAPIKQNGPATAQLISSVDSLQQAINSPTSHLIIQGATTKKQAILIDYNTPAPEQTLTATELLSASIEKVAREHIAPEPVPEKKSSAFEAQAKLTQSISSVCRAQKSESKMKDINLNSKTTDPDTANGNTTEVVKSEIVKEDNSKNEKSLKNSKNNSKKAAKMANVEAIEMNVDSCENYKDETDKVIKVEQEVVSAQEETDQLAPEEEEEEEEVEAVETIEDAPGPDTPTVFVPKYKYTDEQWSPLNKSGKKCYDIGLLKQIKEDPLSKNKPNAPLLEACNVIRTTPMQEPMTFTPISRPVNNSLFPTFLNGGLGGSRTMPRDPKKDGRNMAVSGKGSVKLSAPTSNNSGHKPVIHVSLSLREDVKLREVDSAWKPTRFRKENSGDVDKNTQELFKKFRGILNKLTPQKFETLMDKVQALEINNQKRLEGVIDLLFEKAIEEPNFSESYANMCHKLSNTQVPSNNDEKPFTFRTLIISKCQNQFETGKSDEQVKKYEKEIAESDDPSRKKELQMMINEENRKVRLRAVANVRFIGELYKLKMLNTNIMDYCMKHLIDKLEEEKLECLCKLLTTIGEQFHSETQQSAALLDGTFKKMQEIVKRNSNKISSRVKFMIQDVIDLKRRGWVVKSVVDSQPKKMDQIQKEAEQQQRQIEFMNAGGGMGGGGGGGGNSGQFRRDDGGRGKRGGDNRRQNNFVDNSNNFARTRTPNYIVDKQKLQIGSHINNVNTIKLAPTHWNHGASGAKPKQAPVTSNISISKNKFSVLANVQTDPTSIRDMFSGNRDSPTYHSKGASIERSTFSSKGEFPVAGSARSGSVGVPRSPVPAAAEVPAYATAPNAPQEPLPDDMLSKVKSINLDEEELVVEVKHLFPPKYHAAVIAEILNIVVEKAVKDVKIIAKSLFHLVVTNTIAPENFVAGLKDIFEFAPDLLIDIPMLYDYIGIILTPHIEKKYITLEKTLKLSDSIISANQGHLLLKSIIYQMNDSMGPTFVKSEWQESELQFSQWMSEEMVPKWIADNKLQFLEGGAQSHEESVKILSPSETQSRILQLMNTDQSSDCIKGWVQDKVGLASQEDWFMRALIQAICEHALYGASAGAGGEVLQMHFSPERMGKYAALIHDFGESKQAREANCLFGIQHLLHKLEHPQGLTLEIFQNLHEQYLISLDGFLAWGDSEKEPEGKAVMLKALTSFFTSIQEADNEDTGSED